MSLETQLKMLEEVSSELRKILKIRSLKKAFPNSTIYSSFKIREPVCEVFTSSEDLTTTEQIDSTLKLRLNKLSKDYPVYWYSESQKEGRNFTRTYWIRAAA
ncbi:MAG TPA: hypothetical protein VHA12_02145 [Candidatus Nanoarchaeia archaeon]|nr:hypothetical protein [Candidatus Nanoarchaeia archaeon]